MALSEQVYLLHFVRVCHEGAPIVVFVVVVVVVNHLNSLSSMHAHAINLLVPHLSELLLLLLRRQALDLV